MDTQILGALIALCGVIVGIVGRETVAIFLAYQKREHEKEDRSLLQARARQALFKAYADPLREAAKSLRFRLDEIINKGQGRYLLVGTPKTTFVEYKWTSSLYRLAALLGWIRAFRRERSFLDPEESSGASAKGDPLFAIEAALADGQHVEQQRLNELLFLWRVNLDCLDQQRLPQLATAIDGLRAEHLKEHARLSAVELSQSEKVLLAARAADMISATLKVDIPPELIEATAEQASVYFGIKEAYIYRDWQAAIGDIMIRPVSNGPRRFDVVGFGEFEALYISAPKDSVERRWLQRLEALFLDLDMSVDGMFDARRGQLRNLHAATSLLEAKLSEKTSQLSAA